MGDAWLWHEMLNLGYTDFVNYIALDGQICTRLNFSTPAEDFLPYDCAYQIGVSGLSTYVGIPDKLNHHIEVNYVNLNGDTRIWEVWTVPSPPPPPSPLIGVAILGFLALVFILLMRGGKKHRRR